MSTFGNGILLSEKHRIMLIWILIVPINLHYVMCMRIRSRDFNGSRFNALIMLTLKFFYFTSESNHDCSGEVHLRFAYISVGIGYS